MRRGEIAGLRWSDLDLDNARLSVRRPRVEVEGEVIDSEPKTAKGKRTIALDPATLEELCRWSTQQSSERATVGPGYHDSGLVFTKLDGDPSGGLGCEADSRRRAGQRGRFRERR